jgi:hypothetical protein
MKSIISRKPFFDEPLFIDGLTRSGKTMLAPIICSLNRVEKVNVNYQFEFIPMLNIVNSISDRAAVTMMRYFIENQVYENAIGRNMNFRSSDLTSVWNTSEPIKYISRLNKTEGDSVFENIIKSRQFFLLLVHDALWHAKIYFKAFPNLKMIHIDRHPVDLIYSWYKKGYGSDFYDNPRNALLTLEWNKKIYPYYAHEWEEEYINLSEMGRIIKMVNMLQNKGKKVFESFPQKHKNNVFFVKFEEIVSDPKPYVEAISKFLETKQSGYTSIAMEKEKVPRLLKLDKRKKKQSVIKELSEPEIYNLYLSMVDQYESD